MLLLTSDLHLSDLDRDEYRHVFMRRLPKIAANKHVDAIFILGDLTEQKDLHPASLVKKVFKHVSALRRVCPVYILRGNHDYLDERNALFSVLGYIPGVKWIEKPMVIPGMPVPGGEILCLPHTRNSEYWPGVELRSHRVVFAHQTFKGAKSENGFALEGLSTKMFKRSQVVVSGDVHVPQKVGPVTYVGAPYPVDFADKFKPRVLFMDEDGGLTARRYDGVFKRSLDIACASDLEECTVEVGDIVQIKVRVPNYDYAAFLKMKEVVEKWASSRGCKLHSVQPVVVQANQKGKEKVQRRTLRSKTDLELFEAYIERHRLNERLSKAGLRFMERCQ